MCSFESLHEAFTSILVSGKIVVIDMVMEELKAKELDLFSYIKKNAPEPRLVKFSEYILSTQQIINTYYDKKGKIYPICISGSGVVGVNVTGGGSGYTGGSAVTFSASTSGIITGLSFISSSISFAASSGDLESGSFGSLDKANWG